MHLLQAMTFLFRDRRWPITLARAGVVGMVPLVGQLFVYGWVLEFLRRHVVFPTDEMDTGPVADLRVDWATLWAGFRVTLVIAFCGIGAGIVLGPLLHAAAPASYSGVGPVLVQAAASPTNVVILLTTFTLAGVCFARLAVTDSLVDAFRPDRIWALLRAEPAVWIATALCGVLVVEVPPALVWIAPVTETTKLLATLLVSVLLWPYGLLIQAHLTSQAYRASIQTQASRRTAMRLRW